MTPRFATALLSGSDDLTEVYQLRHKVFVEEMGAQVPKPLRHGVEQDAFDPFSTHLVLHDTTRPPGSSIIGVYRMLDRSGASMAGGFYCASEYDISPLQRHRGNLLELGRSCLHPEYRGGIAMFHLWEALKSLIAAQNIDILFGVASFPGNQVAELAQPLSLLHRDYLAPMHLRPSSREYVPMNRIKPAQIDRKAAVLQLPALIKAYLRMGGKVGDGAFVDRAFNTVDICMVLETAAVQGGKRPMR